MMDISKELTKRPIHTVDDLKRFWSRALKEMSSKELTNKLALARFTRRSSLLHVCDCRIVRKIESSCVSESIYQLLNDLKGPRKCVMCSKPTPFVSLAVGYREHCSNRCVHDNPRRMERTKQTCLINNGVEFPLQSKKLLKKFRATCTERLGAPTPFQSEQVKVKTRKTLLERYGGEHPTQCFDILTRAFKSGGRYRDAVVKGHRFTNLQGFEEQAIRYLVSRGVKPTEIETHPKTTPLYYVCPISGKRRRYFPDLLVKGDIIVEVKSHYTFNGKGLKPGTKQANKAKLLAAKQAGYKVRMLVMGGKGGKELLKLIRL